METYVIKVRVTSPTFSTTMVQSIVRIVGYATGSAATLTTQKGIEAYAGGGQASATILSKKYNRIDLANGSVKIIPAVPNNECNILNNDTDDAELFPAVGEKFKDLATNASIVLVAGQKIKLICYEGESGVWTVN